MDKVNAYPNKAAHTLLDLLKVMGYYRLPTLVLGGLRVERVKRGWRGRENDCILYASSRDLLMDM